MSFQEMTKHCTTQGPKDPPSDLHAACPSACKLHLMKMMKNICSPRSLLTR